MKVQDIELAQAIVEHVDTHLHERMTLDDLVAPDEHGRLFGLLGSIYAGALPFGMVAFGALADGVSLHGIMVVSGLAVLLAAGQTRRMFSQQR